MNYLLICIELVALIVLCTTWVATPAQGGLPSRWRNRRVVGGLVLLQLPLALLCVIFGLQTLAGHRPRPWFIGSTMLLLAGLIAMLITWRQVRAGRWLAAPSLLAVALPVAVILLWLTISQIDLAAQAQVAALRLQAGAQLLSVSPPTVVDQENAATYYQLAFERLKEAHVDDTSLSNLTSSSAETAAILRKSRAALAEARNAAALSDCRWSRDYARPSVMMLLPELQKLRLVSWLLKWDADAALARGDVPAATADARALLGIARQEANEPILISTLVAWAIQAQAAEVTAKVLPRLTQAEQLNSLPIPANDAVYRSYRRALRGERAFGIATLADFAEGDLSASLVAGLAGNGSGWGAVLPADIYRLSYLSDDVVGLNRLMDDYEALVEQRLPVAQAEPRIDALQNSSDRSRLGIIYPLLMPPLHNIYRAMARAESVEAMLQVAVAATHYHLDHGAIPTPEQLVPGYLEALPVDQFDGQPIRMKVEGSRLLLYSVGPKLKLMTTPTTGPVVTDDVPRMELDFSK